jgi:hypothetical protein
MSLGVMNIDFHFEILILLVAKKLMHVNLKFLLLLYL